MKQITICGKQYNIDCNAWTYVNYKKIFNRGVFEDIQIIEDFVVKQTMFAEKIKESKPNIKEKELIKELSRLMLRGGIDNYIEAVTRIAYICVYTADENCGNYEEWLKGIERINTNDKWIVEVTEFAVDCFC